MLERYSHGQPARKTIDVHLILDNGEALKGMLYSYNTSHLIELMNSDRAFLEFESYGGSLQIIAKSTIRNIVPVEIPSSQELDNSLRQFDRFDPFAILGITREADETTLREAYRDMVKLYHPDRYAGMELPREVLNYMASVSKRINAAFTAVLEHIKERKKAAAAPVVKEVPQPQKPVFKMTAKRRTPAPAGA